MTAMDGALASLKNAGNAAVMVKQLVQLFDSMVGVVDASGTATVNVTFAK